MHAPLSNFRTPATATALLILPLLTTFLAARFLHPAWYDLGPKFLLGWLALAFLLITLVSILWTACQTSFSRAFLGYALFVDSAAILFLIICLPHISFFEVLRLYLLLAAWVALWSAFTFLVTRFSAPLAAATAIALSSICFAAPVTFIPLVRQATAREAALDTISYATPILPAFQAVKTSLPSSSWPEWTHMYRLSPLAQEIALRSHWHIAALIYTALAVILASLLLLIHR